MFSIFFHAFKKGAFTENVPMFSIFDIKYTFYRPLACLDEYINGGCFAWTRSGLQGTVGTAVLVF